VHRIPFIVMMKRIIDDGQLIWEQMLCVQWGGKWISNPWTGLVEWESVENVDGQMKGVGLIECFR